jgi:biopolymer transport protein ExbD
MPIQFRCTTCRQKLAISRRKAGKVVKCPACAADLRVPTLEEAEATGALVEAPPQDSAPSEAPLEEATTPPPHPAPAEPSRPFAEEQFFDEVPPEVFDDLEDLEETGADEPASPSPITYEQPFADEPAAPAESPFEATAPIRSEPAARFAEPEAGGVASVTSHPWDEFEEDDEDGFSLRRRPIDESGLDMTPMVDVTFLLLIFFMITASFSIQKAMETEAPEPDEEGAAQMPSMDDLANDSVIVEIDENDIIYIDDAQVGSIADVIDELQQKISGEQKREMIIQPHPLAKHGTVVQVTDAGIEVGMQRIRRVTRKGE